VRACLRVEASSDRLGTLRDIDTEGILATPANSGYNEQVIEAARRSVLNGGSLETTNHEPTTTNANYEHTTTR
jgi:hypothetical protein